MKTSEAIGCLEAHRTKTFRGSFQNSHKARAFEIKTNMADYAFMIGVSVGRVHSRECCYIFTNTFVAFYCCFSFENLCFYHLHFFFDEVSNSRNRVVTNQKPEVIRNCIIALN